MSSFTFSIESKKKNFAAVVGTLLPFQLYFFASNKNGMNTNKFVCVCVCERERERFREMFVAQKEIFRGFIFICVTNCLLCRSE